MSGSHVPVGLSHESPVGFVGVPAVLCRAGLDARDEATCAIAVGRAESHRAQRQLLEVPLPPLLLNF